MVLPTEPTTYDGGPDALAPSLGSMDEHGPISFIEAMANDGHNPQP